MMVEDDGRGNISAQGWWTRDFRKIRGAIRTARTNSVWCGHRSYRENRDGSIGGPPLDHAVERDPYRNAAITGGDTIVTGRHPISPPCYFPISLYETGHY